MARAEGSLASQRAEEWEARFNALRGRVDKAEASTRSEVERTLVQFVDSYRELGARTADFEVPDREAGLRFLEWWQEELQAEAKVARAEGSLASQRAEEWEARFNALRGRVDKAEASTRSEVERTLVQFVDSYRELGARTADFEVPDREAGLRFLEWWQEELLVLPTIVEGFMSFASLVTCEGAMNALSREGCSHYEGIGHLRGSDERALSRRLPAL